MKAGDHVERKQKLPNGETLRLVVAVVDGDRFMAQGWPPALEQVEDFVVTEAVSQAEELETLKRCAQIRGEHGEDWRAMVAKRQLAERV